MPATFRRSPRSELVSITAVARALDISESTARRRCDRGDIQSVRTDSGVRLVTRAELDRVVRKSDQTER